MTRRQPATTDLQQPRPEVGTAGAARAGDHPVRTYRYRVETLRVASPVVLEIALVPVAAAVPYLPGQYVMLGVQEGIPERAYSIANAPRPDGHIRLLVTRYEDGVTSTWIHRHLERGAEVTLTGPFGTLVADPTQNGPVLLLAAGCGIAPIEAIAESMVSSQPHRPVTLLFSGRTPAYALHRARLEDLQRRHEQFDYVLTLTRDRSAPWHRRVPDMLGKIVDDLQSWEVFVAGTEDFVRACLDDVVKRGVPPTSVHTEEFYADPVACSS